MNRFPLTAESVYRVVTDSTCNADEDFPTDRATTYRGIARRMGYDEMDPRVHDLIKSMAVSGYIVQSTLGGFNRGPKALPAVVQQDTEAAPAGPGAPGTRGTGPDRPGPAGVPPGATVTLAPAPAPAAEEPLPPGLVKGEDGYPQVADDQLDRVAKGSIAADLAQLLGHTSAYRQMLDNDDFGDKEPEEVLEELLDKIDAMATGVGFGVVGEVDNVVDYDPERHQYMGIVPPAGITAQVWLTSPGRTWTHRGKTVVTEKAWCELYDDELGGFSITKAGDLEGEVLPFGEPLFYVQLEPGSPYRPADAGPGMDDMFTLMRAQLCHQVNGECQHASGEDECTWMILWFDGAVDTVDVPYDHPFIVQVAS